MYDFSRQYIILPLNGDIMMLKRCNKLNKFLKASCFKFFTKKLYLDYISINI